MAYDAPVTMVTGTVVTAPIWNQDVVDNTIFLHSPPGALASNSSNVTVSTGVETVLNFDTEEFDVNDCFDAGGQTDRLVAPIDGIYYMMGTFGFSVIDVISRATIFHSNGERLFHDTGHPDGAITQGHNTAGMWKMNAGEYIRLFAYHERGSDATILAHHGVDLRAQSFGMFWIGSGDAT